MFTFKTNATIEAIDPPREAPGRNGTTQTRQVLRLEDDTGETSLHVTFFGRRADALRRLRPGDRVSVEFELRTKTYMRQNPETGEETEHSVMLTFGLSCIREGDDGDVRYGGNGGGRHRRR